MKSTMIRRTRALFWAALVSLAAVSNANAAPDIVVIGSVDPMTNRVTMFEDLLIKQFLDGGAIHRLYGRYDIKSKSYYFVRAGKTTNGDCLTEVFNLVRVAGNRLALAESDGLTAWRPIILQKLGPTFDCTSMDCFSCEPGGIPQFGEKPECGCSDGGRCDATRPGTTMYGPGQLVSLPG